MIIESMPTLQNTHYSKYKLLKLQSLNVKKRDGTFGEGYRLGGLHASNETCKGYVF
jgi:hypothetical protein